MPVNGQACLRETTRNQSRVANQVGWQDGWFTELLAAVENWKAIHISFGKLICPISPIFSKESSSPKGCVYCDNEHHKSHDCKQVVTSAERRQRLRAKKCVSIVQVPSHLFSLQEETSFVRENFLTLVLAQIGQTGQTSASTNWSNWTNLLSLVKISPSNSFTRCIQTITGTMTKHVEVYNLSVSDTQGQFSTPVSAAEVDRRDSLSVGILIIQIRLVVINTCKAFAWKTPLPSPHFLYS